MDGAPTNTVEVLVVDDQARFRTVARAVVERTQGFHMFGDVADGAQALAVIEASAAAETPTMPGLVLMDIHMPVLDGIEATRRLVARWPDVVVVLLSSYAADDLPDDVLGCGAAGYLHKEELSPTGLRDLWQALDQPERST